MMRTGSVYLGTFVLAMAVLAGGFSFGWAAEEEWLVHFVDFASQGNAAYNDKDKVATQQMAVQDMLVQAVAQATARFLSPSAINNRSTELRTKIYGKAKKYVDSYQVFSETQNGAIYQVYGKVRVSTELLRMDLEEAGFQIGEGEAIGISPGAPPSVLATASTVVPAPVSSPPLSPQPVLDPAAVPPSASDPTPIPTPSPFSVPKTKAPDAAVQTRDMVVAYTNETTAQPGSRGLTVTKREILWVVPEKWEQDWVLPASGREGQFVQSIIRELDDYDYTLHFPEPGSLKMDYTGNITQTQVIELAQSLGIRLAVLGGVALRQERNKLAKLDANLRVINVGAGKLQGEIKREVSMEDVSNRDGAADLASRIAPQLNSLLGESMSIESKAEPSMQAVEKQAGSSKDEQRSTEFGQWTFSLASAQYPFWKEMERILRDQFKTMRVTGLEMGSTEGTIRLDGVDGGYVSRMNGTSLPSGALVHIESFSNETRTVKLSFTPPANAEAKPKR